MPRDYLRSARDLGKRRRGVAAVQHGRHAERARGLEVAGQVVDEHAGRRRQAEPLGGELVDRRVGLAQADLAGDHPGVEQLLQQRAVVGRARRPTSSTAGRCARPRGARRARRRASRRRAPCRRTGGRSGRSGDDARAARRSAARTPRPPSAPVSSAASSARASGSSRKRSRTVSVRQPFGRAERAEGGEHVGGQDAAVVDDQPAAIAHARSAIAGTPASSRSKNASSVVPASRRLYEPSRNTADFHSASVMYQRTSDIERPERSS